MIKINKKILQGPVYKTLLVMTMPIMFANILQTLYQLIDTFWVGRLGAGAVAAVSLSFPILFLLTSFVIGLTMAGTILVAQYNGEGDRDKVNLISSQTLSITTILSIIFGALGYILSNFLLGLLTSDVVVLSQATSYLQVSFLALPFMFIYFVFQSNMRGVGNMKVPMYIVLITVVINFVIDPLFMYGFWFIPALGVSGVAWATFMTEAIAAAIGIIILLSGRFGVKLCLRDLALKKIWVKNIFKIGIPSSLEHSSRSLESIVMIVIVSVLGTMAVASYGLGMRIFSFAIIPAVSFYLSTSALVGNNLGAKQFDRAAKFSSAAIKSSFWFLTGLGAVFFIFAEPLAAVLIPGEQGVIASTVQFIRLMAFTFGLLGIQMVINGTLKASGRTKIPMILAWVHTLGLAGLSYILAIPLSLGIFGVWLAYPIMMTVSWIIAVVVYKKINWQRVIIYKS